MKKHLLNIEEPAARRALNAPPQFALWQLGFRPFYLGASVFAALSIPLWALQFAGLLPHAYLAGPLWHAHEMLFGFALAVIVGFLYTAGRNWANQPTPTGGSLAALWALWLAARVLVLAPWALPAAVANVAFPLLAAIGLAVPFLKARNRRNYFFVALLLALAVAAAVLHGAMLGYWSLPVWAAATALKAGLDIVLFIVSVMAGRVVPMFTNNGVPGVNATRHPVVEKAALGSVLALLLCDVAGTPLGLPSWITAALALAAAAAHGVRWALWQPWRTRRTPLVWVLHAAYAWVPVHLLLRALADVGVVSSSLATHALTSGAIATIIIGMMTRTTRGHTARPLRADRWDVAMYALVLLAGCVRVGVPLLAPAALRGAVLISATLWSAGFALFSLRYGPMLWRARLDGKSG